MNVRAISVGAGNRYAGPLESITPACQIARKTRMPASGVSIFSSLMPTLPVLSIGAFCGAIVLPGWGRAVEQSDGLCDGATRPSSLSLDFRRNAQRFFRARIERYAEARRSRDADHVAVGAAAVVEPPALTARRTPVARGGDSPD